MKYIWLLLISLFVFQIPSYAQVSYGGKPYFPQTDRLRSFSSHAVFEMPPFDLDSLLMEDELNESDKLRGVYQFAHKFHTYIDKKRDAALTVLPDGTKVWTVTIRSVGAYSLNLLLENVAFPKGGNLFVYNADCSHIIGKFDRRNVSESGILPIRPVGGETIIVEYSEPSGTAFEGNFVISEVNHDYRDILRAGPSADQSNFNCMPDVLCADIDEDLIRSTVLLVIGGSTLCSGVLINNADEVEKSYVLTASHCLNYPLSVSRPMNFYVDKASNVVAYFNYNRTACGTKMKGIEEMTLAGSYPWFVSERRDMTLLEFAETPPDYYNAYYAGWQSSSSFSENPYHSIHHPYGAVKKYGLYDNQLRLFSSDGAPLFDRSAHLNMNSWTIGSTAAGSSGSSLFNNAGLLVGVLSGGESDCKGNNPDGDSDYYASFAKNWESHTTVVGDLKSLLDPGDRSAGYCAGYDPNEAKPFSRLSNVDYLYLSDEMMISRTGTLKYVFGNNSLAEAEFAEEFHAESDIEISGVYMLVPPISISRNTTVEILVYNGKVSPETCVATAAYQPKTIGSTGAEAFVPFEKAAIVKGKFFISYKITTSDPGANSFYVYNVENGAGVNTAWIKDMENDNWIKAIDYPGFEKSASLLIMPLVSPGKGNAMDALEHSKPDFSLYYDSSLSTLHIRSFDGHGNMRIYNVAGQLIEEHKLSPGKSQYPILKKKKGSVGIVKVISENNYYSMKFIY